MKNPLANWCLTQLSQLLRAKPTLPRALELKKGDHVYIVLYDVVQFPRSEMVATQNRLYNQGIHTLFVGCSDPTRDMAYIGDLYT